MKYKKLRLYNINYANTTCSTRDIHKVVVNYVDSVLVIFQLCISVCVTNEVIEP